MTLLATFALPLWPCWQAPTRAAPSEPGPDACFEVTQEEVWQNGFGIQYEAFETFAVLLEEVSEDSFKVGSFRKSLVDRGEDPNPDDAWAWFDLEGRWDLTEFLDGPVPGLERVEVAFGLLESEDRTWSTWVVAQATYWRATIEEHPEEEIVGNNFIPIAAAATRAAAAWLAKDAYLAARGDWMIPDSDIPARCGQQSPAWVPKSSLPTNGPTADQCYAAYKTAILACNLLSNACWIECFKSMTDCLIISCLLVGGLCLVAGQVQNWKQCAMICAGACALMISLCGGKCTARAAACRAEALKDFQLCTPDWEQYFVVDREDPLFPFATDERVPVPIRELIRTEMSKGSRQ